VIRITTKINEEIRELLLDLSMEQQELAKRRRTMRILLAVMFALMILLFVLEKNIANAVIGVICGLMAAFGVKPYQRFLLKKASEKSDQRLYTEPREYTIDDSGIFTSCSLSNGLSKWDSFTDVTEKNHFIFIRRLDNTCVIIDKSKLSVEEQAELAGYLKNIG